MVLDDETARLVAEALSLENTSKDVLPEDEAFQPPEPEPWNDDAEVPL